MNPAPAVAPSTRSLTFGVVLALVGFVGSDIACTGVERRPDSPRGDLSAAPTAAPATPSGESGERKGPVLDFALKDLSGRTVRLSDFRGQVVVVDFWATWCTPCKALLVHLEALRKKHAPRVHVIAITSEDPAAEARIRAEARNRGYGLSWLLDPDQTVADRFNPGREVPFTFVVDAEGRMVWRHVGYEPGQEAEVATVVERLLASPPTP